MTNKRSFRIIFNDTEFGRIMGSNPKQAAQKAFTSIRKHQDGYQEGDWNEFYLKETTRNKKVKSNKLFKYKGKTEDLDEPYSAMLGGKEVWFSTETKVYSLGKVEKEAEELDLISQESDEELSDVDVGEESDEEEVTVSNTKPSARKTKPKNKGGAKKKTTKKATGGKKKVAAKKTVKKATKKTKTAKKKSPKKAPARK